MTVHHHPDDAVSRIAAAIGEPTRARMLFHLMDGRARTSTELSLVANVSPSTASAHLAKLKDEHLVRMREQGRYRYYRLHGPEVASVIEGLHVLAGNTRHAFVSTTPAHLRAARTCYDHMAGTLGVALHDRLVSMQWLASTDEDVGACTLTSKGRSALDSLGVALDATPTRRRFVYACLDWSERRNHVGGAVGAALFTLALERRWVAREPENRALRVTAVGTREMAHVFGIDW
ncbi:MAG: metalloregulator ArsR/SmtB family transcription factor [bacterium]